MVFGGARHLMYHLLNNFDTGCTICFHNSIINNSICVITLTLFSINSVYDMPSRSYSFLFDFIYFIYLFVNVLMYTCVIMRDNFWYLLVDRSITTVSIIEVVKTRL